MLVHSQFKLEVVVNSVYAIRPINNLDNVQEELRSERRSLKLKVLQLEDLLSGLNHGSLEFMDTKEKIQELEEEAVNKARKIDEIDMVFHIFSLAKNENNELVEEGSEVMYPSITSLESLKKTSAADLLSISHGCSWSEVKKAYRPKTIMNSMSSGTKAASKKTKESTLSFTEKMVDSTLDGLFSLSSKLKKRKR